MKKISLTLIILFIVTGVFYVVRAVVPGREKTPTAESSLKNSGQKPPAAKKSCCSDEESESGQLSDNSIYQTEAVWKNQSGKSVMLSSLKGKKVVLSMIFANCTYACPIIVNDMRRVESELKGTDNVKFVLVSIDPERDTPQKLKEYAVNQHLDLKRWELLTGSKNDISELAALLGFKYKQDEKGDYSHSNLINVLNEQGEVIFQHEGLNKEISDVVGKIKG